MRRVACAVIGLALALSGCASGSSEAPAADASPPTDAATPETAAPETAPETAGPVSLEVSSPAYAEGETIPVRHTCDGENVSPALEWSEVPLDTVEVALRMDDPDAPGGAFTHWLLSGIGFAAGGLEEGEAPRGAIEGAGDFGAPGYGGPCPPPGDEPHRYIITVYALGAALGLKPGFTADDMDAALESSAQILAQGQLTGLYGR